MVCTILIIVQTISLIIVQLLFVIITTYYDVVLSDGTAIGFVFSFVLVINH